MKIKCNFVSLLVVVAILLNMDGFWMHELKPIIWTILKIWAGKDVAF